MTTPPNNVNFDTTDPIIGTVIAGRYVIESLIGQGGMGSIYLAQHTKLNRQVAIKFLKVTSKSEIDPDEWDRMVKRFDREAQMISKITHPNAVILHDYGTEDDAPYLIMEYLEGEDLESKLQREKRIPYDEACYIACMSLMALDTAHNQGIIHRDIKPSNVFLEDRGKGTPWIKVLDFGAGKFHKSLGHNTGVTQAGELVGTWHYMAPEQALGDDVTNKMDIYAIGTLVYEMITGGLPFDSENMQAFLMAKMNGTPPSLDPSLNIPTELEEVILKSLEKSPDDRYSSALEMHDALAPFVNHINNYGTNRLTGLSQETSTKTKLDPASLPQTAPDPFAPKSPGSRSRTLVLFVIIFITVLAVYYLLTVTR